MSHLEASGWRESLLQCARTLRQRVVHRAFRGVVGALPDRLALQLIYLRKFGRLIDFDHPKTLTEKINWRKLHQRDPRFAPYTDKLRAKSLVGERVGQDHVIPTLWAGESAQDIPFERLDPPYVVKTNHSTNTNIFVRSRADVDPARIREAVRGFLAVPYAPLLREWGYVGIPHRILVERMLLTPEGKVPEDFKFFVYGGHVRFIQCDRDRFEHHTRAYFDRQWQRLPVKVLYPQIEGEVMRPARLDRMLEIAETIGSEFDFVRVDLYQTEGAVYFGEATFYPGGGFDPFEPAEWDAEFGRHWSPVPEPRAAASRAPNVQLGPEQG